MAFDIFLTLLLVLLNGFFVAAEFAIVKVRSSSLSLQAASASKSAAQTVISNLDGFLAATQLGVTLASLGLGWFGEEVTTEIILHVMGWVGLHLEASTAHKIALPVAFVFITVLHIVFGELAPKSLAIRYPTPTALTVSVPLRIFYFVFKPFIGILNGLANLVLKAFGIRSVNERDEIHSEEELRMLVAESEARGAIEPGERELIQNAFDFDDRTIKHAMIPRIKITGIPVNASIDDAMKIILTEGYSRYPVYDRNIDEIKGVVYSKDIIRHYVEKTGTPLNEIMKKAYYVTQTKHINELLRDFQKMRIQIAIVISEFGGTIGIVTLEDVLEELVGDIQDEYDQESQRVKQMGDAFQIIATSYISDINHFLDEPLRESKDYETLAGLLLHEKNGMLKEGAEFVIEGYEMKILKMSSNLPSLVEMKRARKREGE